MKIMNPKRLYLSIMVALTVLCVGQAVLLWFQQDVQDDVILYLGGWILLSMCSLIGSLCAYRKMVQNTNSLRFGVVYQLTGVADNPASDRKYKWSLRIVWKKLSRRQQAIARSLVVCLMWGIVTLFLTALLRVWQTPQPWPQYLGAEVIYLSTGLVLMTVVGAGLALGRAWAGPVGYIFSILQIIWFPVGLLTGALLMMLLKYVAKEPVRFRLKREAYMKNVRPVKKSFASQRQVNDTLLFELDKEDAA